MNSLAGLPYADIAFEVCSAFDRHGVLAVLVGGGAASFYAPEAYQTRDLDFVLHLEFFGMPDKSVLEGLGFTPSSASGTYQHSETPYTLEILKGPLAMGDETITSWETHRQGDLILYVISPMDSVKDRLAHAIHFKDLNAARQAAAVAKHHPIDTEALKSWCQNEGGITAFTYFKSFLTE